MKEYTICLLFDMKCNKVLLVQKKATTFAGKWNGVGGEVEEGETPFQCAVREIKEETGAKVKAPIWIGTLRLPYDCKGKTEEPVCLYWYCASIFNYEVTQQVTDSGELLRWFDLSDVLISDAKYSIFAGDGDVAYFIRQAMRTLQCNQS